MMAWGDRMLKFTQKSRTPLYRDVTHSTVSRPLHRVRSCQIVCVQIGFWTDNGGYYHYDTGSNKSVSYEEILPKAACLPACQPACPLLAFFVDFFFSSLSSSVSDCFHLLLFVSCLHLTGRSSSR